MSVAKIDCEIEQDGIAIIMPAAPLDAEGAQHLAAALADVATGDRPQAILDLSRVETLSSAGIGVIYTKRQRYKSRGGELVICGLSGYLMYTLKELDVLDHLRIAADRADALQALRQLA